MLKLNKHSVWAFGFLSLLLVSPSFAHTLPPSCLPLLHQISKPQTFPVPPGHTRVYRAVSFSEYEDIFNHAGGKLRPGGGTAMEGKWFADSLDSAIRHGNALHGPGQFKIIEVDVPDDAPSLYRHNNIDRLGAGRYLDQSDLPGLTPRNIDP